MECVSKQWRRLVFNKQFVIEVDFKRKDNKNSLIKLSNINKSIEAFDENSFESVLKKCPNITKVNLGIDLEFNSSVLSLIGRYCPRIKSLKYRHLTNDDKTLSFFRTNGHKLEELVSNGGKERMKEIIKFCPNVKSIIDCRFSILCDEDKEFLPKLERIESIYVNNGLKKNINKLKILSDKYSKTMKTFDVTVDKLTSEELKTCFECIARFENLKELTLRIDSEIMTEPIDDCLSLIGQKCNKLLKLDLVIGGSVPISDRFFNVFYHFETIKKLFIYSPQYTIMFGSVECFKHCKQLKHLDIEYFELREDFFANIASFVPNLKSLRIETKNQFSNSFINSFHSMKSINKAS